MGALLRNNRGTASGVARVPGYIQHDLADRAPWISHARAVPSQAASTRRGGGLGWVFRGKSARHPDVISARQIAEKLSEQNERPLDKWEFSGLLGRVREAVPRLSDKLDGELRDRTTYWRMKVA